MADNHWSDEQVLARLYGLGPDDAHLDECPECLHRWEEINLKRRELLEKRPGISSGNLAKQRSAILAKIAQSRRGSLSRLVPALAALSVLAIVLALFYQKPRPRVTAEGGDNAVFEEAFTLASGEEPEAVEPIQALFEVQP